MIASYNGYRWENGIRHFGHSSSCIFKKSVNPVTNSVLLGASQSSSEAQINFFFHNDFLKSRNILNNPLETKVCEIINMSLVISLPLQNMYQNILEYTTYNRILFSISFEECLVKIATCFFLNPKPYQTEEQQVRKQ